MAANAVAHSWPHAQKMTPTATARTAPTTISLVLHELRLPRDALLLLALVFIAAPLLGFHCCSSPAVLSTSEAGLNLGERLVARVAARQGQHHDRRAEGLGRRERGPCRAEHGLLIPECQGAQRAHPDLGAGI